MAVEAAPMEVFDGIMLSDGCLQMHGHNARLSIQLSGAEYLDWLCLVKKSLVEVGMIANEGHPKILTAMSHGKSYDRALLTFNTDPFFTEQYIKWYKW